MVSVTRLKIPFLLPDWVDTSAQGIEQYIANDAGIPLANVSNKIRNIYSGERSGIIIEFVPGFAPTQAQKTQIKNSLKKLWTEVVEETVEIPS